MTRRTRRHEIQPDRRADRHHWRGLAEAAAAFAVGRAEGVTLQELGDRAATARDAWTWPAGWPTGMVFEVLAVTARAFARQGSTEGRERLSGPLAGAARACLDVLDETEEEAREPGSGSAPPSGSLGLPDPAPPSGRLPYAEG